MITKPSFISTLTFFIRHSYKYVVFLDALTKVIIRIKKQDNIFCKIYYLAFSLRLKLLYLCAPIYWTRSITDSAPDYGSGGCRFESCRVHKSHS